MYPLLLLLLLLLAGRGSESTDTVPYDNIGTTFIAVFPENIASYHPSDPKNWVQITALLDNTRVSVQESNNPVVLYTMAAGQVINVTLNAAMELDKDNISSKVLSISSNNNITVQAVSLKQDSLQTALIIPTDRLSTTYLIPPIPNIPGTTDPGLVVQTVTERNPFKLIVVNPDVNNADGSLDPNIVTLTGSASTQVSLPPGNLSQIWLQRGTYQNVTAQKPVAVLFGHPCAMKANCSCGMLYTVLPPAPNQTLTYLIPPCLAMNAGNTTAVLLANGSSTSVVPYSANASVYQIAGTAVLYVPGLLLSLIPVENFGACFVISAIAGVQTFAVIVVQKNVSNGVHVGKSPISNPPWQDLQGTGYTSTYIFLQQGKTVIWHPSAKMAVYFIGNNGSLFGNPAPIISSSPDIRGCAVVPEVVQVGDKADGWRQSLKYCKDKQLELISMSDKTFQDQVYGKLVQTSSPDNNSVWIGMRRRSLNGEWYWVNGDNVVDTNWGQNEPGGVDDGQCAILSLEQDQNFDWRDEDCCTNAPPVCYKKPVLFPM